MLEDDVENGFVLLLGARNSIDPATAEFLDAAGGLLGTHRTLIDEPERTPAPRGHRHSGAIEVSWRELNAHTQVVSVDGLITGVLYTAPARSAGRERVDFCWLPVAKPDEVDVLFGAAEENEGAWSVRWERARAMVDAFLRGDS